MGTKVISDEAQSHQTNGPHPFFVIFMLLAVHLRSHVIQAVEYHTSC